MRFLDPKTDIAFKKLFGDQNGTPRTISFLNAMLELMPGELITKVHIDNTENLPILLNRKKSFIDVSCTDQTGKKYIVEMQRIDEHDFLDRAGFYASASIQSQLKKREPYTAIAPVIFLGVVDFNLFSFGSCITHHFFTESQTGKRTLHHSEFHFVELQKFNKSVEQLSTDQDRWLYLFKHAEELRELPAQLRNSTEHLDAMQVLTEACWSEQEYEEYLAELDVERRKISNERWVKKQLAEKKAEGIAKGLAKGIAQGIAEGELKKARIIAKEMLNDGYDEQAIAKITGLSIHEIKTLRS